VKVAIETTLVKRPALYKGEVGFFANNPMAEEDVARVAMHSETMHRITSEKSLQALKFLWGVVHKVSENCDLFLDKDDAMDKLKLRVGYSRPVYDPRTRELVNRPKSLKRISDEQLRLLTDRILDVVCAEIIPGMKQNDLRREVEEMAGLRT
jgi:hypothetical protein